jgi:hypothetical protein
MHTKLELDVDDDLIREIETYAKEKNKTISQLVVDYFQELAQQKKVKLVPPVTQSLIGILQNGEIDAEDYKQHLMDKYL